MELRHLKIFCAVVESGSVTGASDRVHTVQSNVSMRMKELESELGQKLFIRQKSGVVLTESGRTFLGYARRILQLADESRFAMRDSETPAGPLRLGSMETTAAIRLPQVLARYREACPEVQLSLTTGTTVELLKAVEGHRLDGAFVGGFHQSASLLQDEIFEEELVLVSSDEFDSLDVLIKEMPRQTILVFRTGCFYRSTLESWFYQAGLVPNQVMELGTLDGILSCAAVGMGVTMLPRSIAESYGSKQLVNIHKLPEDVARIKTVFVRRVDAPVTPAMTAFIELARERLLSDTIDAPLTQRKPDAAARSRGNVTAALVL